MLQRVRNQLCLDSRSPDIERANSTQMGFSGAIAPESLATVPPFSYRGLRRDTNQPLSCAQKNRSPHDRLRLLVEERLGTWGSTWYDVDSLLRKFSATSASQRLRNATFRCASSSLRCQPRRVVRTDDREDVQMNSAFTIARADIR